MYRLLVADDESIERMVLCRTLQKAMGEICEIHEAKNGREAVRIFEDKQIQIVILDIEMPGMNGLEAARKMREQDENCIILFLTAFDEFSYAKQAITVRALDYLLKPYDEKELLFAVEEAMRIVDKNQKEKEPEISNSGMSVKEEKEEDVHMSFIRRSIEEYIKNHYMEDLSMHDLAEKMNYSEPYFCKLFKQCFHVNFTAYLAEYRVEIAKSLLTDSFLNIKEVGREVGYADSNYFSRVFKRSVGCNPSEYREQMLSKRRR
ncbi:MAG: response regulator [Dorea sp.]